MRNRHGFRYFARERVDFAIFEVGLGGRLDATNILVPVVTIITRIDLTTKTFSAILCAKSQ